MRIEISGVRTFEWMKIIDLTCDTAGFQNVGLVWRLEGEERQIASVSPYFEENCKKIVEIVDITEEFITNPFNDDRRAKMRAMLDSSLLCKPPVKSYVELLFQKPGDTQSVIWYVCLDDIPTGEVQVQPFTVSEAEEEDEK